MVGSTTTQNSSFFCCSFWLSRQSSNLSLPVRELGRSVFPLNSDRFTSFVEIDDKFYELILKFTQHDHNMNLCSLDQTPDPC